MSPPVQLLALNWLLDKPPSTIHRICADRVFHRGDKHQSLRADKVAKSHEEVIWQFIPNTEELSDSEVGVSVDMDLACRGASMVVDIRANYVSTCYRYRVFISVDIKR